jgi:hypothetical protein
VSALVPTLVCAAVLAAAARLTGCGGAATGKQLPSLPPRTTPVAAVTFPKEQNPFRASIDEVYHPGVDAWEFVPKVDVDNNCTLDGRFPYKAIWPVTPKARKAYIVAGNTRAPFDWLVGQPQGVVWAPEVQYVRYWGGGPGFAFPVYKGRQQDFAAAVNFEFQSPSTP